MRLKSNKKLHLFIRTTIYKFSMDSSYFMSGFNLEMVLQEI